ncbi:MAG: hypothetical protein JSS81_04275 [Acidobacteria bacterium]|nr:hypothetical protein [Acidobacteriota bacterium]
MNNQNEKNAPDQPENEFRSTGEKDSAEPHIQPSEPAENDSPQPTGDPGRTAGKAEGSRETVEEDLKEKGLDT